MQLITHKTITPKTKTVINWQTKQIPANFAFQFWKTKNVTGLVLTLTYKGIVVVEKIRSL